MEILNFKSRYNTRCFVVTCNEVKMSSEDVKLVSDFETITTFCMYGCTEVKDSNGFCRAVEVFVALLSEYY